MTENYTKNSDLVTLYDGRNFIAVQQTIWADRGTRFRSYG